MQERVKKLEQELSDEVAMVDGMKDQVKLTQDELTNYSTQYQTLIDEKQILQEMLEQGERRLVSTFTPKTASICSINHCYFNFTQFNTIPNVLS